MVHLWTLLRMHWSQGRKKMQKFLSETWVLLQDSIAVLEHVLILYCCTSIVSVLLIISHQKFVVLALPPLSGKNALGAHRRTMQEVDVVCNMQNLTNLIPACCFGLLPEKISAIWDDTGNKYSNKAQKQESASSWSFASSSFSFARADYSG